MKKIILASKSPRRKEILSNLGYSFEVVNSDFEEVSKTSSPKKMVKEFAVGKALSVFNGLEKKDDKVVIGADTIVLFGNQILGKPTDKSRAKEMLWSLSGRTHTVITGYCVISNDKTLIGNVCTRVTFNSLSREQIDEYVDKFNPLDKAGAYGIQDGYPLVKRYSGSYTNIVGLPAEKIDKILKKVFSL